MTDRSPVHFSKREREIIGARAKGRTYKEIADDLDISIHTVKTHIQRIFIKADVQSSLQLLDRLKVMDDKKARTA